MCSTVVVNIINKIIVMKELIEAKIVADLTQNVLDLIPEGQSALKADEMGTQIPAIRLKKEITYKKKQLERMDKIEQLKKEIAYKKEQLERMDKIEQLKKEITHEKEQLKIIEENDLQQALKAVKEFEEKEAREKANELPDINELLTEEEQIEIAIERSKKEADELPSFEEVIPEDERIEMAIKASKKEEAKRQAEEAKKIEQNIEISKTGSYLAGNYKVITRAVNDTWKVGSKTFSLIRGDNEEGASAKVIDENGSWVKGIASASHTGFSIANAYFSKGYPPLVDTVLFNARENTDLLKSDNAVTQCVMDILSSTISHLVTFNLYGAGISAGLGVTKYIIKSTLGEQSVLLPVIEVADTINDFANASNVVIKSVEALKFTYSMSDHFTQFSDTVYNMLGWDQYETSEVTLDY